MSGETINISAVRKIAHTHSLAAHATVNANQEQGAVWKEIKTGLSL